MSDFKDDGKAFTNVVWDKDDALKRMGKKPERLIMMINIFLEESEKYISDMQVAYDNHSCDALKACAHAIKGASGNLGAKTIFEMSEQIEMLAANNNYEQAYGLWAGFIQAFDDLKKELSDELQVDKQPPQVAEEDLHTLLSKIKRSVKQGDFLTPGEVKGLSEKVSSREVEQLIELLAGFAENFETAKAVETIDKIAAMENISLS